MITVNQAPALVTKSSLMCWYPGVAGLVAVPLLLLEVEVEVLLQVVGVKLALGGHNCHLREKFNWALFLFSVSLTLVLLPAGLQIGANISSDPFSPLTDTYF